MGFLFDGATKTITVEHDGPVTAVTAQAMYAAWKDWVAAGNAQYQPAFGESVGGNPLSAVQSLAGYFFVRNDLGWRIKPEDGHTFQVVLSGDLYPTDPDTVTTPWLLPSAGGDVLMTFDRSAASSVVLGQGQTPPSPAQNAAAVWDRLAAQHETAGTMGGTLGLLAQLARNKTVTDPQAGTITVYDTDGTTVLYTAPLYEDAAGTVPYRGQGADHRGRYETP